MNRLSIALLVSVVAALTGCKNIVSLHTPEPIAIFNRALPAGDIVTAIKDGASSQGWEVVEEGPGYVLVTNLPDASSSAARGMNRAARVRYATVRVSYTSDEVTFAYVSSENLAYNPITDGKQTTWRAYNTMVNGLAQAIAFRIDRAVSASQSRT